MKTFLKWYYKFDYVLNRHSKLKTVFLSFLRQVQRHLAVPRHRVGQSRLSLRLQQGRLHGLSSGQQTFPEFDRFRFQNSETGRSVFRGRLGQHGRARSNVRRPSRSAGQHSDLWPLTFELSIKLSFKFNVDGSTKDMVWPLNAIG